MNFICDICRFNIAIILCADVFFFFNVNMECISWAIYRIWSWFYFSMSAIYQKFHLDKLVHVLHRFIIFKSHISFFKIVSPLRICTKIIQCFIVCALLTLTLIRLPYFHSGILVIWKICSLYILKTKHYFNAIAFKKNCFCIKFPVCDIHELLECQMMKSLAYI